MSRRARTKGRAAKALVVYRNSRGERVDLFPFTASEAKREFGRLLETVLGGSVVVITRHETPKAVMLPVETFNALVGTGGRSLDTLSAEFDALLMEMQAPKARAGMKAAFNADPSQLGRAAVAAARRRRG